MKPKNGEEMVCDQSYHTGKGTGSEGRISSWEVEENKYTFVWFNIVLECKTKLKVVRITLFDVQSTACSQLKQCKSVVSCFN